MNPTFKKSLTASIAAVAIGLTIASTSPASAGGWNHNWNGPVAAGVVGGLALGAIANGGGYAPAYYDAPVYGECYVTRRPAYDNWGNFVGYRRVRVCD